MQIKKKTIKDIAEVILGFTFRTTLKETDDGNIAVLQAKNITDNLLIDGDILVLTEIDKLRSNALAKNNDVVISSRGNFKSAVLHLGKSPVVASSSTYLLRLQTKDVLPEYLSIYLNSKYGQKQIKGRATGAVISALPKRSLESIEVNIPSLAKQRKAIKVYENNLRYQKLINQKLFLTNKINESLIHKLIIT